MEQIAASTPHPPPGIPRNSAGLLGSAWLKQARLLSVLQLCRDATMSTGSVKTPHLYSLVGNDVLPSSPCPQQHRFVRARHSLLVLALQAAAAHQQWSQQVALTLGTRMGHPRPQLGFTRLLQVQGAARLATIGNHSTALAPWKPDAPVMSNPAAQGRVHLVDHGACDELDCLHVASQHGREGAGSCHLWPPKVAKGGHSASNLLDHAQVDLQQAGQSQ